MVDRLSRPDDDQPADAGAHDAHEHLHFDRELRVWRRHRADGDERVGLDMKRQNAGTLPLAS